MFEHLIENWDGEEVIIRHDQPSGTWIFIAIHSTRLGQAMGGTRLKSYPDSASALADVLKLSAAMTYKYAVPNLPHGGGKAVIYVPADLAPDARTRLLRRYGELLAQLGGLFSTGPDIGTSPEDMDIIAQTGSPHVFCQTPASGGAGSSGPITALGVFAGIRTACEHVFGEDDLTGRRVLVQGLGSVGQALIGYLQKAGARVLVSDVDQSKIEKYKSDCEIQVIAPSDVYTCVCDIFSPNAVGGILNVDTIPQLNCKIIAGGANNQLAHPDDADRLRSRSILFLPDYVVSVGAVMAIPLIERQGVSVAEAEKQVLAAVGSTSRQVIQKAEKDGVSTEQAARRIGDENLHRANPCTP